MNRTYRSALPRARTGRKNSRSLRGPRPAGVAQPHRLIAGKRLAEKAAQKAAQPAAPIPVAPAPAARKRTTRMAETHSIDPEHLKGRHISRAVEVLRAGGVVIYPTDTVYGLGCDITRKDGIERIRRIKGRDSRKPMSFVCADLNDVSRYAHVSNFAYRILRRFLPGPYTFVLPATKETPRILQTRQKTVGLRVPDHPVPLALVRALGHPIISTSANRGQQEVLTDLRALEATLGRQVDLLLECGLLSGTASSVISLVGDQVEILREGQGDLSYFREQL